MNVKLRRIELGIQQQEFAKQLGIGRSTLLKIEKGSYDNVKIGLAKKIAEALDSTVQELFFND
ncbi:helix-turn-helix domain-containing protein [Clostridium algidicarnis]|uniref:helix-turn-helix transcriptional regulator n=1 Tax=Clostridium algidicarnis TaxID=37659 RepID=UPI001C0DCEB2|nr:helix-turn-helix domain-containing protein [Clostridium algidicarnis]MBU3208035.1 helix-turn-helix domain-containing protein [Clostridium algidicarnis]